MKPIAHLSPARSRSRLLSPCSQDLKHGIQTENVGVHSKAGDEALSHVRQDAVDAALCNIADVNLYIGQAGPLNAIFQCKAGISEACRIHTNPHKRWLEMQESRHDTARARALKRIIRSFGQVRN